MKILLLCSFFFAPTLLNAQDLSHWSDFYFTRFKLKDPYQKLVDNMGDGYESLYGTRNFRVVLNGVLYRGGANNYYFKYGVRENTNPLTNLGLTNLCQEGFGLSVYLYSTNFSTAPTQINCKSIRQDFSMMDYIQISPLASEANVDAILNKIHETIQDYQHGPIYLHCWNGWHASGYISALALKQFCGTTDEAAVQYWDKNTDGQNKSPGYEEIRQKIRAFIPRQKFNISSDIQKNICPTL